jgi:hypothetical protein
MIGMIMGRKENTNVEEFIFFLPFHFPSNQTNQIYIMSTILSNLTLVYNGGTEY